MFPLLTTIWWLGSVGVSTAQSAFGVGAYLCATNAGISSLTACDALNSTLSVCTAHNTATASIWGCLCQQQVLDHIVDCESEYRLCYLSNEADYLPEEVRQGWDANCKGLITFTPTTPILSTPFTTNPTLAISNRPAYCSQFESSCAIWSASEASCLNINPAATGSSFLQCACATKLLSLASVCLYDYRISCFSQKPTLSAIALYGLCNKTYSNNNLISLNSFGNLTTVPAITTSETVTSPMTSSSASSLSTSRMPTATSSTVSTNRAGHHSSDQLGRLIALSIVSIVIINVVF